MRVKSMPVLPNWFEIHTYAGRPVNVPDAAANLLRAVAGQVVVEADARRPLDLVRHDVGGVAEVLYGNRIGARLLGEGRRVHAHAVGQRELRLHAPLIPGVEAPLGHLERGALLRVARRREAVIDCCASPASRVVEAREAVGAEVVADEQVLQVQELVVGADGQRVGALEHRVRVVEFHDVLVDRVAGRELLRPGLDGHAGRQSRRVTCGKGDAPIGFSRWSRTRV